jgi:hypothetical protein
MSLRRKRTARSGFRGRQSRDHRCSPWPAGPAGMPTGWLMASEEPSNSKQSAGGASDRHLCCRTARSPCPSSARAGGSRRRATSPRPVSSASDLRQHTGLGLALSSRREWPSAARPQDGCRIAPAGQVSAATLLVYSKPEDPNMCLIPGISGTRLVIQKIISGGNLGGRMQPGGASLRQPPLA